MIKGSEKRHAAFAINPIFVDRWSSRAMSGEPITEQELNTLFEAARWAPSANNVQPWRILYARRESAHWPAYLGLLNENNRSWAQHAAALLLFVSHTFNTPLNKPSQSNSLDTGAAWQSLALQGCQLGLVIHGMAGFDHDRARQELQVPEQYQIEMMVAIGKPGAVEQLPERLQAREVPSERRPIAETVCEGLFTL